MPETLKIVGHPQPWGATRDEVVTFTTFANGEVKSFVWKRDGQQITPSDDILQEDSTSREGSKSTIQLTFNPEIHKGIYQCFVRNNRRSEPIASKSAELKDFDEEREVIKRAPRRDNILLVIIGRTGTGKSSLFNSLLGAKIAKESGGPNPVTEDITIKEYSVNGITVKLVDTPGFGALTGGKTTDQIMEGIAEMLPEKGEEVDVLIYCLSMKERLQDSDGDIAKKITRRYEEKLWQNTVFALTRANEVQTSRCDSDTTQTTPLALAAYFNIQVSKYVQSIRNDLLTSFCSISKKTAEAIPVLPAGYVKKLSGDGSSDEHHKHCILPDGSNWLSNFWYQTFLRIRNPDAQYAFFRATCNIHPFLRVNEHRPIHQPVHQD